MDFTKIYKNYLFANNNGVILEELNSTHAIMSIKIEKHHLNAGNVAHGGVIYLLADISLAAIANLLWLLERECCWGRGNIATYHP